MNYFQKLRTSNLVSVFKQETDEPQSIAEEGLSDELARLNRVSGLSGEIERVQKEMDLAMSFVNKNSDELLADSAQNYSPDEYLLYHYGAFLNLVHQMKDKILHLCDGMTTVGSFKESKGKKEGKKGLGTVVMEKEEIQNMPGLVDELQKWEQSQQNVIAYALCKRTTHHHTRSNLTLDKSYQDYQIYKTFLANSSVENVLTEYGKKVLAERGINGFKNWHLKIKTEMTEVREFTETSIQVISKILYENGSLLARESDFQAVLDAHQKMADSLKITNVASREKMSADFIEVVASVEKFLPNILGDNFISMYLIGSVARGDAVVGVSDLSIIVVLKEGSEELVQVSNTLMDKMNREYSLIRMFINITYFLESEFLGDKGKKLRFLCGTEGFLLAGKDILPKEKYPKPGTILVSILNGDVMERVQKLKRALEEENIPQSRVDQIAREVAKIAIRVFYSAFLSNRAVYERSLPRIVELLNGDAPQNKPFVVSLYKIASGQVRINLESLSTLSEIFDEGGVARDVITQLEEKNERLLQRKKFR
jgi:predicted nucleotidyltransferase